MAKYGKVLVFDCKAVVNPNDYFHIFSVIFFSKKKFVKSTRIYLSLTLTLQWWNKKLLLTNNFLPFITHLSHLFIQGLINLEICAVSEPF